MKYFISSTALIMAIAMTPAVAAANNSIYDAHERCKRGEDSRQVIGGLAGAVVGGVLGSQVSGNGARTEGSAIGAVIGGLAGAGIADKTIDCDPVYTTTGSGYPAASTTQYGSRHYSHSSSPRVPQNHYEDRVTVSNHPVYSDPYYGAGAVSQGRTYSAGTVTYPPAGNNSQYASRTYGSTHVTRSYTPPPRTTRHYSQAQPVTQRVVYSAPAEPTYVQHRPYRTRHRNHHHGRYSCNMGH